MHKRDILGIRTGHGVNSAEFTHAISRHERTHSSRAREAVSLSIPFSREAGEGCSGVAVGGVSGAELIGVADPVQSGGPDVVEGAEEEVAGDAVDGFAV